MVHAVHNGALMPATALAVTLILPAIPSDRNRQNVSGASAVIVMRAWRASDPPPPPLVSVEASASCSVAKNDGSGTLLVRNPSVDPKTTPPKLYLFPKPVELSTTR